MKTLKPITPEVALAATCLEMTIGRFLSARPDLSELGRYESQIEACNLFSLVARHAEAVVVLAREDLVLLPPAMVTARAAFEIAVKAAWMVDVNDPFDGEVRWLAHLEEEERLQKQGGELEGERSADGSRSLQKFRMAVASKLPPGKKELTRNPSFREMLESLNAGRLYAAYRSASQFTHGGHNATWLYRKNLGTEKQLGEFIEPADWYFPFHMSWLAFSAPAQIVLRRLGGDGNYLTGDEALKVEGSIDLIKGPGNTEVH